MSYLSFRATSNTALKLDERYLERDVSLSKRAWQVQFGLRIESEGQNHKSREAWDRDARGREN